MATGSNALSVIIRNEIDQHSGLISFARFMELALYHREYGYYNTEGFDLGKHGDFTTASEISPLFAKCFAHQCLQIIDRLGTEYILELGAGSGRFAGELLLELDKLHVLPKCYYIYEISDRLREKQRTILQSEYPSISNRVVWLDKLPDNFKGIIIANEVLDALPVNCFRIDNRTIKERCVTWEQGQFAWKSDDPSHELELKVKQLLENYALPDGYESEINLRMPSFIEALANSLNQGVILFSDYGYGQEEYYHPERCHGSLTCFHQHHHHDNPFILPGSQDITAHVNFTSVVEAAVDNGCTLAGYTTQASFLFICGLIQMAEEQEKNLPDVDKFNLHQAIKLLTMPTEMGERVKVMALGKNIDFPLLGFSLQDRRREL